VLTGRAFLARAIAHEEIVTGGQKARLAVPRTVCSERITRNVPVLNGSTERYQPLLQTRYGLADARRTSSAATLAAISGLQGIANHTAWFIQCG